MRGYADEVRRAHGLALKVRVGLNSGEVVVRAVGSDLRMDYSAVGQTTHLAARLEQLADPGSILLTADTLRLAEGYVAVRPLGPVLVKGLDTPVEVYELTGAGPQRSRLAAAAARGLTRFVGRDAELEQIRRALARVGSGHGQVVAAVGEPGVGKSRLVWEVTHSHRTHGWLALHGGAVSYGKATPYLPVRDVLKAYFGVHDTDGSRHVREKVTGKTLALDRALEATLPALLHLLEPGYQDAAWEALDPSQRRQRTLDAIKRLLIRESQAQPLCLVVEDLHWIDSETQALLDGLVESLPTARLLLLVNYRPEYAHAWGGKTYYTQVRLDPLPAESAAALLDSLLGPDPALRPIAAGLIERTGGNPFFLEECVQTLVETRALVGERGAYRPARVVDAVEVPATVQAMLAARIDRLPPEGKHILQCAAVIGKDIPLALLGDIADQSESALRSGLAHLQGAEFLYETRIFPDLEYTFKHALTHDVAYASLLQERRRALHARIMSAMETRYPDRMAEHAESLGHHAIRGEAWAKAVLYLRLAGSKALARSANREAAIHCREALAALRHLPESRATLEQALDIQADLRGAITPLAQFREAFEVLHQAEEAAARLGDERRLAQVWLYLSNNCWVTGRLVEARALSLRAQPVAEALGDPGLRSLANINLGLVAYTSGDYRLSERHHRENVALLTSELARQRLGQALFPAVNSRMQLARALAQLGAFAEGVEYGHAAIALAEELNHPYSLAIACNGLGELSAIQGNYERAISVLERGMFLARELTLRFATVMLASSLAVVYARLGRVEDSLRLLRGILVDIETIGMDVYGALMSLRLGEALWRAGQIEEARDAISRALTLARQRGERGHEAEALCLLGDLEVGTGPAALENAESHLRAALALASELEMRPLVARCHLGLGALHRVAGRASDARAHVRQAVDAFRDMGMVSWLEQAEATLTTLA
jgi:tetratricopeptide (TPR) repeat protein